jgi:hypothetical protein
MDPEEQSRLLSQIHLAESHRSDLRTTIAVLNSQIESLRAQEHAVTLEINHLTNAHSPFNWLPDDILREIFLWCIGDDLEVDIPSLSRFTEGDDDFEPESDSSSDDADSDTCTDPECDEEDRYVLAWPGWKESDADSESLEEPPQQIILSHICSRWRRLTLSTHELWSSVFITFFDARSKQLATEWLSKAAGYPVSISISSIHDWDSASHVEFNIHAELRDFLSAYKIKMLDLPIYSKTWPQLTLMFSELPDENISFLEKLSLIDLDDNGRQEPLLLNSARYPRLRFLELSGLFECSVFILPWNTLRELDITFVYLPFAQCLHVLRQCTSLDTCSFGVRSSPNMAMQYEPVHHPNLSRLFLYFNEPAPVDTILRPLTVPNLTSLTIDRGFLREINRVQHPFPIPLLGSGFEAEYLNLMQRSKYPSIQHLFISYTDIPINIANLLVASPSLTRLTIGYVAFGQTTFDELAEGQLGPNLHHLGLVELGDASLRKVLDMILSRNSEQVWKEGVTPFRSVELLGSCLDDANLKALREVGVEPRSLPTPRPLR